MHFADPQNKPVCIVGQSRWQLLYGRELARKCRVLGLGQKIPGRHVTVTVTVSGPPAGRAISIGWALHRSPQLRDAENLLTGLREAYVVI